MNQNDLVATLRRLYPSTRWPKPFNLLEGWLLVEAGTAIPAAAREIATNAQTLKGFIEKRDFVAAIFGDAPPSDKVRKDARQILGNLIVGKCAELTFEEQYKTHMHTTELELRDLREGRSDTDYRLFNGKGRPVYRVNIKYIGSLFRRAKEMVGLEPEDCFALATYKIHGALKKQEEDELPYIFVVVSVPGLRAEDIGAEVPSDLLEFATYVAATKGIPKKRNLEDRIVDLLQSEDHPAFAATRARIQDAQWYILSARKANKLLTEKLFDRVFALRTRNFSRQFGGAELDMHFSLSQDLTPLTSYLDMLRDAGYPRVTTLLERGDF